MNILIFFAKAQKKSENYGYADSVEIKEYIDGRYGINRVSYAYQYQHRDGRLIFRYDNVAHRPALGFEDHKHFSDGTISEAVLPDISDLIDEVLGFL